MKKSFIVYLIIFALLLSYSLTPTLAKKAVDNEQIIPEVDGTYDVPGHPDLKVRVFVHKAKPDKPGKPTPTPEKVCNLDDPDSTFVVSAAKWKLPATFTYNLNLNNVPALVGSNNWLTIAENSFQTWENEIPGLVSVSQGADTTMARKSFDGKNIVAWGTASGSTLGVTYIWYDPATKEVKELDTIMNQKFFWTWSGGISTCAYTNSYDAQSILTHEIGHWFGLDDEYDGDYANNTMFGYGYKKDAKGDTLTTGDIAGLQAIYQ